MLAGWNHVGVTPDNDFDWGVRSFDNEVDARRHIWEQARLFATDLFIEDYEENPVSAAHVLAARLDEIQDAFFGKTDIIKIDEFYYWVREEDK